MATVYYLLTDMSTPTEIFQAGLTSTQATLTPLASDSFFYAGFLTHVTAHEDDDGEIYVLTHRAGIAMHPFIFRRETREGFTALGYRVSDGAAVHAQLAPGAGTFYGDGAKPTDLVFGGWGGAPTDLSRKVEVNAVAAQMSELTDVDRGSA